MIHLTHSLMFTRSARSARQHKAWGEASAASETPGPRQINETSPRSGRQPLKRILKCWEQFWHGLSPAPRARLIVPDMILGFRPDESGLHPRLYASARSAGFVHQVDNLRIFPHKMKRSNSIIALGILLVFCPCVFALNPSLDVNQYDHASWKLGEAFSKGIIRTLAQTPDGYLWLGTEFGLLRFDGVRAVPWEVPPGEVLANTDIRSLQAGRDGRLWIGTFSGLASWKDNKLIHYPELDGQVIEALLEDHQGTIWVAGWAPSVGRLCRIESSNIQCYGEDGHFGSGVTSLKISPRSFVPRRSGAKEAKTAGALVTYTLSGPPAVISFTIEQAVPGVLRGGKCGKKPAHGHGGKRCTRFVRLKGSIDQAAVSGRNTMCFTGRLGRRTMAPGDYRLVGRPRGAKGPSASSSFRIARKRAAAKNGCSA